LWLGQKLLWLVGVMAFCKYKIEVLAPVPESLKQSLGNEMTALTMALPPTNSPVFSSFSP
jgi:hypothetical protein